MKQLNPWGANREARTPRSCIAMAMQASAMQLSPLGALQLCFVGFNWHTGSLKAAADALNQHMEKIVQLNFKMIFFR